MAGLVSTHMFRNFIYQKTIEEILEAMTDKVVTLHDKIKEREARVAKIRSEYDITDSDMIKLLSQAANDRGRQQIANSYNIQSTTGETRLIAAGVIQNVLSEKSLIESEEASVIQLQRIGRNLKPVNHFGDNGEPYTQTSFSLSDDEIDFLGF